MRNQLIAVFTATGNLLSGGLDGNLYVWDKDCRLSATHKVANRSIMSNITALDASHNVCAIASQDYQLVLLDYTTDAVLHVINTKYPVKQLKFSPSGNTLIVLEASGLRYWRYKQEEYKNALFVKNVDADRLATYKDYIVTSGEFIHVYHADNPKKWKTRWRFETRQPGRQWIQFNDLSVSEGGIIAAATDYNEIYFFDLELNLMGSITIKPKAFPLLWDGENVVYNLYNEVAAYDFIAKESKEIYTSENCQCKYICLHQQSKRIAVIMEQGINITSIDPQYT